MSQVGMKALVLAGGTGTRMRPFSYSMPKQLIPIANRPVLLHCLDNLREAGITDVGMIVGPQSAEIRATVGDGAALGLSVTYIEQDRPRGLAHCIMIADDFLGDEDFVMYLGDNVVVDGITEFADAFRVGRPDAQLLVTKVADPTEYGIAELDSDGEVLAVLEKPLQSRSDLAVVGVYFFTPAIHEAVRSIQPSQRGEYEITEAIQWLVASGARVQALALSGYWKDAGRIEDMLGCNRVLLEATAGRTAGEVDEASTLIGEVVIEAGARVVASTVIGPTIIGADTVVTRSEVGPYASIGRSCVLVDSAIEDSIVLDWATIQEVRDIRGSLVGRGAQVHSGPRSNGHRLLIGDHASVRVVA
jgi:glucose-1-phosphate thymidylyltransferase